MKSPEEILDEHCTTFYNRNTGEEEIESSKSAVIIAMEEYAKQFNKWTKVEDGKPDKGQSVLVIQNPRIVGTKEPLFAIYNGENFIPPEARHAINPIVWSEITHWMTLSKIHMI